MALRRVRNKRRGLQNARWCAGWRGGLPLDGLLLGVGRFDPTTFVVVPVVLAGSTVLAVYLPARRATRVDPAIVLRGEG